MDAFEPLGPVVEVLLVPHLPVLEAEEAPLETAVAPPVERLQAPLVASERHELDVVGAARLLVWFPLRRITMRDDQHGVVAELVPDRLGVAEEHQVGVEIRDRLESRLGLERV